MVQPVQAALDDELKGMEIISFSGGRNTEKNIQTLSPNESPNELNLKFVKPDRAIGRDGWIVQCTLPAIPDGQYFFYDKNGGRRIMTWAGGNLYETTGGGAVLLAAACYTAGKNPGHTTLNGKMYWSDGIVTLQQYDPLTATNSTVVSSGAVGAITPPAFKCAMTLNGQLVVGATTVAGPTFEPDNIRWCNFEDPTTWLGTSLYAVDAGQGGEVNCVLPLPFNNFFVGKSRSSVWSFSGALAATALIPYKIQLSTGVLDGLSARYVTVSQSNAAGIYFVGNDRKAYYCNGIQAQEISVQIRSELSNSILSAIQNNVNARISGAVNVVDNQYIIDIGMNTQYAYDYNQQIWTLYQGWPSGDWDSATDRFGFPTLYVSSNSQALVAQVNTGATDNGTIIPYYWQTGFISAPGLQRYRYKVWQWLYCTYATDIGHVEVTVQPAVNNAVVAATSATGTLASGGGSVGNVMVWDQSLWDQSLWSFAPNSSFTVYRRKLRTTAASTLYPTLKSYIGGADVIVTLGQTTVQGHFELLGTQLLWLGRGLRRTG